MVENKWFLFIEYKNFAVVATCCHLNDIFANDCCRTKKTDKLQVYNNIYIFIRQDGSMYNKKVSKANIAERCFGNQ